MNSEKSKSPKSNQNPLIRAGCSVISFLTILTVGIVLVILSSILPLLYVTFYVGLDSRNIILYIIGILFLVLASLVGVVYMVGKKLEHWTHLVVRYRGMQHERKRIERLIKHTEAETVTETDTLDYLAEVENTDKAKYS